MIGSEKSPTLLDALKNLSGHLDSVAGQVFELEEALSETLSQSETTSAFSITRFQKLDFIRQSLEDCALLLHLLSSCEVNGAITVKDYARLNKALKLEATRRIISSFGADFNGTRSGDIDLF